MDCKTCGDQTSVRIGTSDFCRGCGERVQTAEAPKVAARPVAAPVRRSMDMGPRSRGAMAPAAIPPRRPVRERPQPTGPSGPRGMSDLAPRPATVTRRPIPSARITPPSTAAAVHTPAAPPVTASSTTSPTRPTATMITGPAPAKAQPLSSAPQAAPARQGGHVTIPAASQADATKAAPAGAGTTAPGGRYERARATPKSAAVSKFSSGAAAHTAAQTLPAHARSVAGRHNVVATPAVAAVAPELPPQAATAHQAMQRLLHDTPVRTSHTSQHLVRKPRHAGQIAATAAAIVLMSSYIWIENSPKLAIGSAASKAGIAATMPAYVPSSYSLVGTDAASGLVTLKFAGADKSQTLQIAQTSTEWDSRSLLENFIAPKTRDYAAVDGQGLTIYLFGLGEATWINHGIRYAISGASHLSREQILKIAYSL